MLGAEPPSLYMLAQELLYKKGEHMSAILLANVKKNGNGPSQQTKREGVVPVFSEHRRPMLSCKHLRAVKQ